MAKCDDCGTEFEVEDARDEYNSELGSSLDYDEDYGGGMCGNCAIAQTQSYMNVGRAIQMVNGDEHYDDDFVQEHL